MYLIEIYENNDVNVSEISQTINPALLKSSTVSDEFKSC